jgi:carbon monoxide dehydrogenase subunit G|tara:strand:+ start:1605 stop:2030 length:426 start_codon:yes stop_codon:yes gene_type:complete
MANIIPDAFKSELLSGTHNFANGGNSFKIALYTDISGFSTSSTAYTTSNEVSSSGTSYTAGGNALDSQAVAVASNTAFVDFADEVFSSVTLSAVGAVIYNDTNSDKLVVVLDFGGTKTATNGDFTIQFPAAGASTAILRIA